MIGLRVRVKVRGTRPSAGASCLYPRPPPGARCQVDRDCGPAMCCARHHGEKVCKRRLVGGESCYVPVGGLAFSINQICPCDEGLLCRGNAPRWKE